MDEEFQRLLQAAKNGDTRSWGRLIHLYSVTMKRWAAKWAGDSIEAEELLQDFWLHLIDKSLFTKTRAESPIELRNFLITALRNHFLQKKRRERVESEYANGLQEKLRTDPLTAIAPQWAAKSAEEEWLSNHLSGQLEEAIMTLGVRQRAVILLLLEGHTNKEIAEALDLSSNTVASDIHRAKQRIAQCLEERVDL